MGIWSGSGTLAIYSGKKIVLHQGSDEAVIELPTNVMRSIKQVASEFNILTLRDMLIVRFKNGHSAKMDLDSTGVNPYSNEALKKFQATCIMLHDL
jgi:hypothetical protein